MRGKNKVVLMLFMLILVAALITGCEKETAAETGKGADVKLSECTIVYDKEDYMSTRYAYRLFSNLKLFTGDSLEYSAEEVGEEVAKLVVTEMNGLDGNPVAGKAKITVEGNTVNCQVDSYYGFEALLDYFEATCEKGEEYVLADGFTWEGSYLDTLKEEEGSAKYAYNHTGEYRVMFNNVLWRSSSYVPNDKPGERNRLTVEMAAQYLPDVFGLQECNDTKRSEAQEENIVTLLEELGYAEVPVTADNSLGVNCTPIFYRKSTVIPVTGGYLNYKNQPYQETEQNKTSKALTWCLFETPAGDSFIVVSTHLETRYSSVRYNQAEEAAKLIDALIEKYDVPVIMGGDFNTVTGSTTFKYLTETAGYIDVPTVASEFSSIIKPHHSYPQYKINKNNRDFSCMQGLNGEIIVNEGGLGVDHIVMTNEDSMKVSVYGVVVDDCTKASSDHFPTFMDFSVD